MGIRKQKKVKIFIEKDIKLNSKLIGIRRSLILSESKTEALKVLLFQILKKKTIIKRRDIIVNIVIKNFKC